MPSVHESSAAASYCHADDAGAGTVTSCRFCGASGPARDNLKERGGGEGSSLPLSRCDEAGAGTGTRCRFCGAPVGLRERRAVRASGRCPWEPHGGPRGDGGRCADTSRVQQLATVTVMMQAQGRGRAADFCGESRPRMGQPCRRTDRIRSEPHGGRRGEGGECADTSRMQQLATVTLMRQAQGRSRDADFVAPPPFRRCMCIVRVQELTTTGYVRLH